MEELSKFSKIFESALQGLLNHWRVWCGEDEIRALPIGFDSANTEICVSLLTDREPDLERQGINPFRSLAFKQSEVWPTADWRLTGINKANHHCWPDAAELLDWMERKSDELDGEKLNLLNQRLKSMFFDVATSDAARNWIGRFRRVAKPFRIRVEWYFDDLPLDAVIG